MKKEEFKNGVLYLGDCLDVLQTIPDNTAEIAITSPPYNLHGYLERQTTTKTSKAMTKKFKNWYRETGDEEAYQSQQKEMLDMLVSICSSSIFYNHKIRYAFHGRNKFKNCNRIYHPIHWINHPIWCEIIWDRKGIGNPTRRYHNQTEKIYQIGKPRKWKNPRALKNIWSISPSRDKKHPCAFPSSLVWNCMETTTEEGDTVMDPYIGSGTTAIVAIQNKRRFIGIERDPIYFQAACERIHKEERQIKLF